MIKRICTRQRYNEHRTDNPKPRFISKSNNHVVTNWETIDNTDKCASKHILHITGFMGAVIVDVKWMFRKLNERTSLPSVR